MGCSGLSTVAASPSIVTMWSFFLICPTGTEQGLNDLPLMKLVHARQTSSPQPYFGPWTLRWSRRTQSSRTSFAHSTWTRLPLTRNVCFGISGSSADLGGLAGELQSVGGRLRQRRDGRIWREAEGLRAG